MHSLTDCLLVILAVCGFVLILVFVFPFYCLMVNTLLSKNKNYRARPDKALCSRLNAKQLLKNALLVLLTVAGLSFHTDCVIGLGRMTREEEDDKKASAHASEFRRDTCSYTIVC